ncbi:MAG: DUF11 domain-containing protein [Anaerolineae bacterium]|nr:DUF11 domain-containing protein [Anaerolineae bacterium]
MCRWLIGALVIAQLWGSQVQVAAQPTGYQEYYVLGYEEHIRQAFLEINDETDPYALEVGQICSTVSLVATAGYQVVYYDQWEDGYEADLINPVQSTTLIFGDGNPANGGSGSDILRAGDAINLLSTQNITGMLAVSGYVPVDPTRNPADIRYDGGDRLFSIGGPVNLTHAMWPLDNSWIGGSWEVPSRQTYKDTYVYSIPVGEDLYAWDSSTFGDFRDVYVEVLSYEDNTTLSLDNGGQVVNIVLDRGQTYYSQGKINSTDAVSITIHAGAVIRSNKPVQVGLITGSVGSFQSRFFAILPDRLLGAEYIVPVPSDIDNPAEVYLFNPNDFEITVYAYDQSAQTIFPIAPSGYITSAVAYSSARGSDIPPGTAVRLFSPDGVFGVLVCADSAQTAYDWGFAAVPAKYLTREYYVPWAPGSSEITPTVDGSPVWVAPLSNGITFYVDFNSGGLDGVPDQSFTLDVLEQRRVFDPDNDNTGMHIWATGEFAAAWGEDPDTADVSTPYLDMGIAILPPVQEWIAPLLTIDKQAEPTILPPTGGTVTFALITRSYDAAISDIDITDTLPISWTYVPGSTRIVYPLGGIATPDPVIDGRILSWDLNADLNLRQSLTLTFQAQITDTTQSIHINRATAVGYYGYAQARLAPVDEAVVAIGDLDLYKQVSHADINVGSTLVYTLTYQNTGAAVTMTNVLIRDVLPVEHVTFVDASSGGAYDGASGAVTWVLGALAPGATGSVTLTVQINNFVRDGVQIRNIAYINSDQLAWANSNTVATRVHAPEMTLLKSAPTAAARGRVITYTLNYQNTGSADATNVLIWDTIPLPTTYVPGSLAILTNTTWIALSDAVDGDAGVFITPTLIITPGAVPGIIAAGESGQIRFSVRISDTIPRDTLILNWATLDHDLDNPRDSNLVITRISELILTKSASQTVVSPGGVITYTLAFENLSSTEPQTNVYVREPIPSYTRLITDSVYGGQIWYSWDNGATFTATLPITPVTHLRWYTDTVPTSTVRTVGFAVRVQEPLPPNTTIRNLAHISSTEIMSYIGQWMPSNQIDVQTVDLSVAKSSPISVVSPGEVLTYTVIYSNGGSLGVTGAVLTDIVTSTRSIAWPGTQTRIVDVGAGTSGVWEISVATALTATCGEVITNTALLAHAQDSSASAPVTATVNAPYSAAFTSTATVVCLGTPITFTNASTGALYYEWSFGDGTVTDTISPMHNYILPGTYTVALTVTTMCGSDVATRTVTVVGPPVAAFSPSVTETWPGLPVILTNASTSYTTLLWDLGDGTVTDTISPVHIYALPGTYTVTLTITSAICGADDVATGTVQVRTPVLEMHKEANVGVVSTGEVLTYTIVISNASPGYATGGVVSDTVPSNTTLIPGSIHIEPLGVGVVGAPPDIIENLNLAPGAVATVTLAVRVDDPLPGGVDAITNTAVVTVVEGANPSAQAVVIVSAVPELEVTKTGDRGSVRPGEVLTYTLVVRNQGTQSASGVILTDTLPLSVTVQEVSGSGVIGADQVIWTLGVLDAGDALTETVVVTVSPDIPFSVDVLTNTVEVNDDGRNGPDPIPANNSSTHTATIDYTPALTLVKTGPSSARVGERVTFVLTVSHDLSAGDGFPVTAVNVTDSLAGTAAFAGGDDGDGLLEFDEQWTFTVDYVIRPTDPTPLVNVGRVEARDFDGDLITATASHQTNLAYAPNLFVIKRGPATARVGNTVVFTITVSSVSIVPTGVGTTAGDGSPIYGVTVSDDVAGTATYVSGDDGDGILEFGEPWTFTVFYLVQVRDIGSLENTATAVGYDGNGNPVIGAAKHVMIVNEWTGDYLLFFPIIFQSY